ncbi:hypothetical protein C8R44DRAFT_895691 [Mycena epipterygia]|nr:hypothetical protein C8R44DRAFT_895691 [Mycena epipterygia]
MVAIKPSLPPSAVFAAPHTAHSLAVPSFDEMSDTEVPSTASSPLFFDDASDTATEPPSPGGSTKGLYVRSRPTSMDGSVVDFPGVDSALDFTQFGMTAAPAAPAVFPLPPIISSPPAGKKRRYAVSVRSLYTGTGTGTSLHTNRATVVPVQLVRRDLCDDAAPVKDKVHRRTWTFGTLKKIVPGLFPRPTGTARALKPFDLNAPTVDMPPPSTISSFRTRSRALSIKSFKSTKKSKARAAAVEAENRPPPPMPLTARLRVHSFSGYTADAEADLEDEDETDAEMTAITREAVRTALRLNEEYEFAPVDPNEIGIAL